MARVQAQYVVVTDVDGCLLDHGTYSYAAAAPTIARLKADGIPLILCSSKTRAELERLRAELGLDDPFVVENGGAVYVPIGAFPFSIPRAREVAGYEVVEFARRREEILPTLLGTAANLGIDISTFSGMSLPRVAAETGLPERAAILAKRRDYDEPFRLVVPDPAARTRLCRALRARGLRCVSGGRFDHVTSGVDKGMGVDVLRRLYAQAFGDVVMIGLGDSLNDVELLRSVDHPVVVRNPTGGCWPRLLTQVPGATVTHHAGPQGWAEAVERLLDGARLSA